MKGSLKTLLLAGVTGLSLSCIPSPQQTGPTPKAPVSQELLSEFSDSLNSYSLRLQKASDHYSAILDTSSTQPTPSRELAFHAENRLKTLNRLRNLVSDYGHYPLNLIDRINAEITMKEFIKTSNYSDVESTLSDLELWRQSCTWNLYADILASSFPEKN